MAEYKVTTVRTTTAFFVDGNGIRKFCDTAIRTIRSDVLELVTSNNYCVEQTWRLQSQDGFNFMASTIMMGEHEYSLFFRLFMQDNCVLLYGGWERLGVGGEMVIEGQLCGLIFPDNPNTSKNFLPAA